LLELVIKHQIGKMPLREPVQRLIPSLVRRHGFDILPITSESILKLATLPLHRRDPFDRLLVAQAMTHNLTLVTPDPLIAHYHAHVRWK
jgi:PIN domain nuclease of toxin-antitoxin system